MDNLGDWLYIIIIVIAGLSSLFSSLKKKKRPTDVLGQPGYDEVVQKPTNEKGFWELFEEELQGPSAPPPPPAPVTRARVAQLERPVTQKYNLKDVNLHKYDSSEPILQETTEEDENYTFGTEAFHDVDELRKAIIYTEILKRKY